MDIYDIKIDKGMLCQISLVLRHAYPMDVLGSTKAELQLELMEEEQSSPGRKGSCSLLSRALKIVETQ